MKNPARIIVLTVLAAVSLFILTGCNLFGGNAAPTPYPDNGGDGDPFIGMPNPASFYCQEMGYELKMQETNQGTAGICVFPNGAECEEWEFLAGGCSIEWTFCQRQGYNIRAGEGMAVCTFPDGSTCPEYDFFIGECQPPQD